jgi:hypothetical protein
MVLPELEALIMKRLAKHPHCGGIIQVYVKATIREPFQLRIEAADAEPN